MSNLTRRRTSTFVALLGSLILIAACDGLTGPERTVNARVENNALQLTNTTGRHAYYFVVNTDALPLINWAQCVGDGCNGIAPGERVTIQLGGPLQDGGESGLLTTYWWHAVNWPSGPRPGPVQSGTISLR
jgi:hypothetical protein